MPRAIWSGAVSFGLVNIPVKLFNAVSRKSVSFNQIDRRTGSRIRYKKVSAADGEEVPNEEIVKGYELGTGEFVLIDDEELATLDPEATRSVDIEEFVELADIDPIFYDAAYYLAPDKGAAKPYKLLAEAMEESGKVALARFVMRTKQYLAAIRAVDGRLVLSTMVYSDEVNDPADLPEFDELDKVDVSARERSMAEQLIESLTASFKPEQYQDTHREQVLELIERKAAGEEVVAAPAAPTAEKVVDLMAALEASVSAAKEARKRHPAAGRTDGKAKAAKQDEEPEEAEAAPAKRATGRKRKSA
jgi:DNA end-binding protein Ku